VKPAYSRQRANKKLFAAWRLCEKKKIAYEKSKKEKRTKDKKRYGAQRRRDAKK
jgi:hypothetical protein